MMNQAHFEKLDEAFAFLQTRLGNLRPQIGLILGSGLGDYADTLEDAIKIPYAEIPHFPQSTVEGHVGQFVLGKRNGTLVLAMQGRVHYYEGYDMDEVVMPIRLMQKVGIKSLILTNAAGGVNVSFGEGALMVISDHINFSGRNPLIGPNEEAFGVRFPDMSDVYTKTLRKKLKDAAKAQNISLEEGVYMFFSGPSYETPAEIRMARTLGADAVGMSTVPEAIVARHGGMQVLGISCITNMAAGVLDRELHHAEVQEVALRVKHTFIQVLDLALTLA